jgi:hypothetical protein
MRLAWLAAPLLAASFHTQVPSPGAAARVVTEFRVFNGSEEVTSSTRLRVVPAGKRGAPATDVERGVVDLAPAVYDVQAIRTSDSGIRSIKWAERLAILHYPDEGGRHLEVINFQSGYGALQLRATRGRLNAADVAVFETGDHATAAGRAIGGDDYVLVVARAGRYDVRVQHADHGGTADTHWLLAVDVPAGRTRLKLIDTP